MPGQGMQPEREPIGPKPRPQAAADGVLVVNSYIVPANFTSSGNGNSVSLDMSSVDDMGGDDVTVYAATSATPSARSTGTTNRQDNWTPAANPLSSSAPGGAWVDATNYWVQLVNTTDQVWYQGNISAASGRHDITLTKRAVW